MTNEKNLNPIPKSFMLFGRKIEVVFDDDYCNAHGMHGQSSWSKGRIYLLKFALEEGEKRELKDDQIEQNFFHELIHMILDTMGRCKLSNDEEFVSIFSGLLHQFTRTVDYGN